MNMRHARLPQHAGYGILAAWFCTAAVAADTTSPAQSASQGQVATAPALPGSARARTESLYQGSAIPSVMDTIPDWQARVELARLLSYARRYDEAALQYERVLSEKPELALMKAELAQVLFCNGRKDEAYRVFATVTTNNLPPHQWVAFADICVCLGKMAEAEAIYRTELARVPDSADLHLKLANILAWTKRYDESFVHYEQVLKATPDNIQARRRYALALSWSGNREAAITQLRMSLAEH